MSSVTLLNPQQATTAWNHIYAEQVKPLTMAGHRLRLSVKRETRSLEANARLHAMIADVAKQKLYLGHKRDIQFWKGLFVSGWEIATGQKPEIVPGLEGEFINIRESTTTMSGKKIAGVMEYLEAWGTMNGVVFSAPKSWGME